LQVRARCAVRAGARARVHDRPEALFFRADLVLRSGFTDVGLMGFVCGVWAYSLYDVCDLGYTFTFCFPRCVFLRGIYKWGLQACGGLRATLGASWGASLSLRFCGA
jgi:hypothetical protein